MKISLKTKMHCSACEKLVEQAVGEVAGVASVKADSKTGKVAVDFSAPATGQAIRAAIVKEGYPVE